MKHMFVSLTLLCAALTVHAASTPSVQNVRFAQESSPTDLVLPPQVLAHPAALYTDEARRRGIQGNVVVQGYFDANGAVTVLKVVKGLGYGLDEAKLFSEEEILGGKSSRRPEAQNKEPHDVNENQHVGSSKG